MESKNLTDRIDQALQREEAIDRWWELHKKMLREVLEKQKLGDAAELRRMQIQLARVTEERDLLLRKLLEARQMIDRIREMTKEK